MDTTYSSTEIDISVNFFQTIVYYFGYGSNINTNEMNCIDHNYLGIAKLDNYKLAFTTYSKKRGGGVLDIVKSRCNYVLGALYEIGSNCEVFLDKKEGVSKDYYRRIMVPVEFDGKKLNNVLCYEVVDKDFSTQPEPNYCNVVLEGMLQKQFVKSYIENFKTLAKLN